MELIGFSMGWRQHAALLAYEQRLRARAQSQSGPGRIAAIFFGAKLDHQRFTGPSSTKPKRPRPTIVGVMRRPTIIARDMTPRSRLAFHKAAKSIQAFLRQRRWWRVVDSLSRLQEFRTLSGPSLKLVFADDGVLTAAIGPPKWTPTGVNVCSWCAEPSRLTHGAPAASISA